MFLRFTLPPYNTRACATPRAASQARISRCTVAALRVAHEGRLGAGLGDERTRHGAGEGSFGLPMDVLGADQQVGALARRLRRRLQRHGGWEEPYLALLARLVARAERLEVGARLVGPDVHLPVGGEPEGAAHASSGAATPGSGLPSRNSSDAPPPVETWVNASSRPATAAAESPPPTTVTAPRFPASTMASATLRVPASNGGVSNTPMGPFQKIVRAPTMRAR